MPTSPSTSCANGEKLDRELLLPPKTNTRPASKTHPRSLLIGIAILLLVVAAVHLWPSKSPEASCDKPASGYQCRSDVSHNWGQYSPYFSVQGTIPDVIPSSCSVTFAQALSRHGARFPTAGKSSQYNDFMQQLHSNVTSYKGKYAFLADYEYTLGADDLTTFGEQQMVHSGGKFFSRYEALAHKQVPFFRSASQERVVVSAQNFTQGFHTAKVGDPPVKGAASDEYPYGIEIIQEGEGFNNTLSHELCTAFEEGSESTVGFSAMQTWRNIFAPPITARLNQDLPGANLSAAQVIYMMDLCPFETVASGFGTVSAFCDLFTTKEWVAYGYYQSLGKWYGYGMGNSLGPTQGVGYTNELIARMTNQPVRDATSTNHTLDSDPATFPIGPGHALFADFSHDNDLEPIFAALGLYNSTAPLSKTFFRSERETNGFSAAWTVPFAARAYFEKQKCEGTDEELVRILVNDRVIPLQNCGADALGRCKLSLWVESLSFAQGNGHWDQCFS